MLCRGDHFDGEALEIAGFGNGDEDGVVCALVVFGDVAQGFLGIHGCGGDVFQK